MKKLLAHILMIASVLFPFAYATPALALSVSVGNPAVSRSTVDSYSNFTIIDTNNPVSANGTLTTFSYYAANTNPFEFVLVDASNVVKWISPVVTPAGVGVQTFNATVSVQAGWNLGVHFDLTGTIPFDWNGAPAAYTPNNNGMPLLGVTLSVEGTSNGTYSWNGSGADVSCTTLTLMSGPTSTQFKGLTTTDPAGLSTGNLFTFGTPGLAVVAGPDGFPGAWSASTDPVMTGASWVNNMVAAPSSPAGSGAGQNGSVDTWRLFSQSFTIPAGAVVSPTTLHLAADNSVQAFADNASVGSASSFSSVTDLPLVVTPGSHELEFVVKNDRYNGATNPTGLLYKVDINYCVPVTPPPVVPVTKDECKKDGWMTLVDSAGHHFKNQGDCVSFVATKGKNKAAGN